MKNRCIPPASKKWLLSVLAACGLFLYGAAQNGVAINTTGAAPDASAILDLSNSVSKGFLLPKFLSTSSVSSPATGLMIYQTTAPSGIYCNVGTPASPTWILLSASTGTVSSIGMTVPSGFSVSPSTITSSGTFAVTTALNGLVYGTGSGFATAAVSAPLTYNAGTLGITQAGSTTNGYLSSTDWNTFNNKISGNQTISLTGDATGTGTTSIPVTLAAVNSNIGTFNTVTVNAKGLVTGASNTSYQGALNGTGYVKQAGTTTSYVGQIPLTSDVTGILPIANGGTNISTVGSAGSVIYSNGIQHASTAAGTSGQILTSTGTGAPAWTAILPVANGGTGVNSTTANYIFAGPSGSNGPPAFRAITAADIPPSNGNYIQNNATVTAQSASFNISGAGVIGGSLVVNGPTTLTGITGINVNNINSANVTNINTGTSTGAVTIGGTANNVAMPKFTTPGTIIYSSTAGGVLAATAAGTTGQILTSAGASAPTWTTTLPIANGGTNTSTIGSAGSVIYSNGTQQASTAVGTSGQILTSNGSGVPTWASPIGITTLGQSATTAYGSGSVSTLGTTSTSLVSVISTSITLTNASAILISTYGGGYSNSTAGNSSTTAFKILVDNVATTGTYFLTAYYDYNYSVAIGADYYPPASWSFTTTPATTLAAGTHTITVAAYLYGGSSSGSILGGAAGSSYRAALTVAALKP